MHGHLEVLQWLHSNRREGCTTKAMDWAAMEGKLVRAVNSMAYGFHDVP